MITNLEDNDVEDIKLTYIELRFSDGETRVLSGSEAQRWFDAVSMRDLFCQTHGLSFPKLEWDITKQETILLKQETQMK